MLFLYVRDITYTSQFYIVKEINTLICDGSMVMYVIIDELVYQENL